jgi:hypothetical protein
MAIHAIGRFAMRNMLSVFAVSALGLLTNIAPSNAEITYPWCAEYNADWGGGRNCGFTTWEQCRATVSGNDGFCALNPIIRRRPETPRHRASLADDRHAPWPEHAFD